MNTHTYQVMIVQNQGGKGGSEGRVATMTDPSNSNFVAIQVQSPAEFKGPGDEKGQSKFWTPDHLFVSSVAVCFFTTFVAISERSNLRYKGLEVHAEGTLDKNAEGIEMITQITEKIHLKLEDLADKEKALKICEKTEKLCLIANSMKSKIVPEFLIE